MATHDYVLLKWFDLFMDKGRDDQVRYHSLYRAPETGEVKISSTDVYLEIKPNAINEAFNELIKEQVNLRMGNLGQ